MLEFWIDPESPYHKPVFAEEKKFVFFCAGGMRSALAAQTARQRVCSRSPTSRAASAHGEQPAVRWNRRRRKKSLMSLVD
jgi:hypothetical protein